MNDVESGRDAVHDAPLSVLVVDDNVVDREKVARLLGGVYSLLEAGAVSEALELASSRDVGCVLLDYRLPDRDGDDAIEDFNALNIPVVMLTAQGDEAVAVRVMKRGALDYLVKGTLESTVLHRAIQLAFERRRLQEQLAETSEALAARDLRLGMVLRRLPVVAWEVDEDGRLHSLAGAGLSEVWDGDPRELLGTSVAELGSPLRELITAPSGKELRDVVELPSGQVLQRFVDPSGERAQLGMTIDITESKALEGQLRHGAKMEALGKLAGGVAHDFNNILTAITTFARFARQGVGPDREGVAQDLDEVLDASARATNLVKQLLAFSRNSVATLEPADPGEAVAAVFPMLRRLIGETVELELERPEKRWWVPLDATRLESVVVNLVVNARDALVRGGQIQVAITNRRLTRAITRGRGGRLEPGDYVVISVADNGSGMPPAVLEKLFDPFFTTKDVGKGTGLGLSTVYGLVKAVNGTITVYSEVGRGSTFRIYLPRVRRPDGEERPSDKPLPRGGGRRILLVEDDEAVRRAMKRMLEELTYEVECCHGMDEVLAKVADPTVAGILSDVVMADFDGFDLAERVQAAAPHLPVLLMSGHTERALEGTRSSSFFRVLEKPIDPATLAHELAHALGVPSDDRDREA